MMHSNKIIPKLSLWEKIDYYNRTAISHISDTVFPSELCSDNCYWHIFLNWVPVVDIYWVIFASKYLILFFCLENFPPYESE